MQNNNDWMFKTHLQSLSIVYHSIKKKNYCFLLRSDNIIDDNIKIKRHVPHTYRKNISR